MPRRPRGRFGATGLLQQDERVSSIGPIAWSIHLVITLLAAIELLREAVGGWVPVWAVALAVLSLAMIFLHIWQRRGGARTTSFLFGSAHSLLAGLTGLGWGIGALLCSMSLRTDILTFYTLVVGGVALGGASVLHAFFRSCLLSIWAAMPLLAWSWVLHEHGVGSRAIAVMILLFGVTLTAVGFRMNRLIARYAVLAEELEAKNAELIRAGGELAQSQQEKSQFLARASHDLRQPIHAIGLLVEYLRGLRLGPESRGVLANIDRSLDSLARLCRSLLDLSALDVGRIAPQMNKVPVADILGEVVRQNREVAEARGVTLRYRPSRIWARCDAALLQAMVQNLVSNSIKYAPGCEVIVGVRRRKGKIAIMVADTGPGIAESEKERVFQEFVRLRPAGADQMEGLGLGLPIVKRLARLMNLDVILLSQPGRGTCFFIDGLTEVAAGAQRKRRSQAAQSRHLRGMRVLIVDDDRQVRSGTAQLLASWGCDVRATDRPDADVRDVDFLLCDQDLQDGVTGLDVIRRIRMQAGSNVAADLVTGCRVDQISETCKAESILQLEKPVRPAQLRSALLSSALRHACPTSVAIAAAAERDVTSSARRSAET